MKSTVLRGLAVAPRFAVARLMPAVVSMMLGTAFANAAVEYTFSNTGADPYSFSLLEPSLLTTTGAFPIAPFQVGGLSFTQATLTQAGGTGCFQFGTAGATLTATPFSCGLSAFAPQGGWQSLFFGAIAPGTYTAFNAVAGGAAPPAPNQLTIQNVAAYQYTFSHKGTNPFSFSFLTLNLLDLVGPLAIPPLSVDGITITQGGLTQTAGTSCFQFGTAGASLTEAPFSCGLSAFAPDCGFQSLFFGASAPGTYTAFNAVANGACPTPGLDSLTIDFLPAD